MMTTNIEKRILDVLNDHINCADEQELNTLAKIILSAVRPTVEGDVGRSYETKLNNAATQLGKAVKALKVAKGALVNLDELAREALSRQVKNILDADDFSPIGTSRAWIGMGYDECIEQFADSLSEFAQDVSVTHEALLGKSTPSVRGAPPKDGPRAVAQHCVLVYREFIGPARHPSWDPYNSETYGATYLFVKSIFEAAGIKASAEDMLRQVIEKSSKI